MYVYLMYIRKQNFRNAQTLTCLPFFRQSVAKLASLKRRCTRKSSEFFLKRKPRPKSIQRARYIVSGNKKRLDEREPRRRGVGTCCFRFAGAEEGVTERMKGWEKEGGTPGGDPSLCTALPLPLLYCPILGTIGVARSPLLYASWASLRQHKFSHIFEKTCYTPSQKDSARRPFVPLQLVASLSETSFSRGFVRQVRPVFTGILYDPDYLGRLTKWPGFAHNEYFSRCKSKRKNVASKNTVNLKKIVKLKYYTTIMAIMP